jgi:signal transduction histidine kinase
MTLTLFNYAGMTLTAFLAVVILLMALRQRRSSLEIEKREALEKQRLYQISILKEIQDKIGYSLDIEKIVDVITASLRKLFPYSTASSILIKENKLVFKTHVEENVNRNFLNQVKKTVLASLNSLVGNLPIQMEEELLGIPLDETKTAPVQSFFNIPLIVGNNVVGLINISSRQRDLYKEDEMTILYQIVDQASNALLRLQNVLETEKGKLTSMISSLADGVFMVDTNHNLLIINPAAKQFLGIRTSGPVFNDVLVAIGKQYNLLDKIAQSLQTNSAIEEKEVTINSKVFQIFITPVPKVGASILLHDITVEKNIALIKEDFTNMMVHELRAPLTAIKDSAELMTEAFDEKELAREEQKKLLTMIDQQTKSLLEQIGQVLDAAKIEAGRFSIYKTPADIAEIINNAVETFLAQAHKKQIFLCAEISSPLPKVEIDALRIAQVLNNLISNSLKFTHIGGKITVSAEVENEGLKVSVSDNGIGIPEQDQKDLFSKYYQIETTPHQLAKKGTGLGLYITKGIVEAHGGSVGVVSEGLNKGTTIYFILPISEGAPQILHEHYASSPTMPSSTLVN